MVGAIGDGAHWEFMKFLKPGHHREPADRAHHGVPLLHPGHGGRRGRDRLLRPEHVAELAQLLRPHRQAGRHRVHGPRRAHLERLQVVLLPHLLRRQGADARSRRTYYATALKWLYDSIKEVKVGTTTKEIASKWPSAKEAWGYEEEDQAAANLWGHGLGLAQYDQPVISRIWSLDHPIEIKEGMVFALETQHGKKFEWGVRIEEMLIVHKDKSRSSPTSRSSRSRWSIRCRAIRPRRPYEPSAGRVSIASTRSFIAVP